MGLSAHKHSGPNGPLVSFSLDVGGTPYTFSQSGSGATSASPGTTVSGSGFIDVTSGGQVTGYTISLDTKSPANTGTDYEVIIPGAGTLDLNPQTAVPEPSTLLLTIPGAGALLLLRCKKRS